MSSRANSQKNTSRHCNGLCLETKLGVSYRTMSLVLNAAYLLVLLLVSPLIVWRACMHGRYRKGWGAKLFGILPIEQRKERLTNRSVAAESLPATLWFHAVSVGELQVIRPLVERTQSELPDARLVITTSTDSGYALARQLYSRHEVHFAPLDFTWAIRNAFDRIQPTVLILAELELWPNWLRMARRRSVPVYVVNARLSESSFRGYQRASWIFRSAWSSLTWVGAQSPTYRERFLALGVPDAIVETTGNIKFDGASPDRRHPEVQARRELAKISEAPSAQKIWLCGSTQHPEEELCLQAFTQLAIEHPELRLILVPRHPERFEEVAKAIAATGVPWTRRSQLPQSLEAPPWRVLLIDSVGELRWWWGTADLGFVGGSFGNRGGQNMIEPCAYGVATSFGPNTRNFADVVQLLLENQAAVQLRSPEDLRVWVATMLRDAEAREQLQVRACETVLRGRGAVDRTWSQLRQGIEAAQPPSNGSRNRMSQSTKDA